MRFSKNICLNRLADEELRVMVAEAISETGAEGPKAIGKVMPAVMAKAKAERR